MVALQQMSPAKSFATPPPSAKRRTFTHTRTLSENVWTPGNTSTNKATQHHGTKSNFTIQGSSSTSAGKRRQNSVKQNGSKASNSFGQLPIFTAALATGDRRDESSPPNMDPPAAHTRARTTSVRASGQCPIKSTQSVTPNDLSLPQRPPLRRTADGLTIAASNDGNATRQPPSPSIEDKAITAVPVKLAEGENVNRSPEASTSASALQDIPLTALTAEAGAAVSSGIEEGIKDRTEADANYQSVAAQTEESASQSFSDVDQSFDSVPSEADSSADVTIITPYASDDDLGYIDEYTYFDPSEDCVSGESTFPSVADDPTIPTVFGIAEVLAKGEKCALAFSAFPPIKRSRRDSYVSSTFWRYLVLNMTLQVWKLGKRDDRRPVDVVERGTVVMKADKFRRLPPPFRQRCAYPTHCNLASWRPAPLSLALRIPSLVRETQIITHHVLVSNQVPSFARFSTNDIDERKDIIVHR